MPVATPKLTMKPWVKHELGEGMEWSSGPARGSGESWGEERGICECEKPLEDNQGQAFPLEPWRVGKQVSAGKEMWEVWACPGGQLAGRARLQRGEAPSGHFVVESVPGGEGDWPEQVSKVDRSQGLSCSRQLG